MELGCWISWELGSVAIFQHHLSVPQDFWDFLPSTFLATGCSWITGWKSIYPISRDIPNGNLVFPARFNLEKWWDWIGGWIPLLGGVFQGFSDPRLEFLWDELVKETGMEHSQGS